MRRRSYGRRGSFRGRGRRVVVRRAPRRRRSFGGRQVIGYRM